MVGPGLLAVSSTPSTVFGVRVAVAVLLDGQVMPCGFAAFALAGLLRRLA